MFLLIAIGLALGFAALRPLSEGLLNTSMWVSKMWVPPDSDENETTKQLLIQTQSALMDGWLSNIPFVNGILLFSSIVAGFIYTWWAGILMFFIAGILGGITKALFAKPVSYYLPFLYHKMVNRMADYRAKHDSIRAEAAEAYCNDITEIMEIYQNSKRRPPTPKQLREIPYGALYYWLEDESTDA